MTKVLIHRRGIHGLLSVAMLIGFTLGGAALLFAVVSSQVDVVTSNAHCTISDVSLYRTGPQQAYFIAALHNLGSTSIEFITVTFVGSGGDMYDIINKPVDLMPEQKLNIMESFSAAAALPDVADDDDDDKYLILVSAVFEDGSHADC